MSIKQQVLTYLNKVETATITDILSNIEITSCYFKEKHLSVIVSELVKEGKVSRIKNGLFKIKTKVQTNQIGLFI